VSYRAGSWIQDGLIVPALIMGAGIAAVFDGVVFHQVLQWHHMLSGWHPPTTVANLRLNTRADGWFDLAAFALLLVGVSLLWRVTARAGRRPPWRLLAACVVTGAGAFNVVEGVVDHELLGIHHVREGADAGIYDAGFLAASLGACLLGAYLLRRGRGSWVASATRPPSPNLAPPLGEKRGKGGYG
jgi:uncharacterized membrane protein